MSLLSLILGRRGASGFGYASTAEEVTAGLDLRGKNILITGVNSGLGQESARVLALRGARIVCAARTVEKASEACRELGESAIPLACELSEPASVHAAVETLKAQALPLDVILCNAGIMALPRRQLRYGQELQFLTNHVGHFILVTGLLESLREHGRVVMLSSAAHTMPPSGGIQFNDLNFEHGYSAWAAYGQSKLANLLFARTLARRLAGSSRTSNAVHPGVINTNLARHSLAAKVGFAVGSALTMKSIPEGAATSCYVATNPGLEGVTGEYFADSNLAKSSLLSRDVALGDKLWTVTEEIVANL